jgi:hypothetical protein
MDTVAQFVAEGYGLGVSVAGATTHRGIRTLPLPGFPLLEIAALWVGQPLPPVSDALAALRAHAHARWPA